MNGPRGPRRRASWERPPPTELRSATSPGKPREGTWKHDPFRANPPVLLWAPETVVRWSEVLEGFRRLGTAMYLFGIAFGLGTIIQVLRFQSQRIRDLANGATT